MWFYTITYPFDNIRNGYQASGHTTPVPDEDGNGKDKPGKRMRRTTVAAAMYHMKCSAGKISLNGQPC